MYKNDPISKLMLARMSLKTYSICAILKLSSQDAFTTTV